MFYTNSKVIIFHINISFSVRLMFWIKYKIWKRKHLVKTKLTKINQCACLLQTKFPKFCNLSKSRLDDSSKYGKNHHQQNAWLNYRVKAWFSWFKFKTLWWLIIHVSPFKFCIYSGNSEYRTLRKPESLENRTFKLVLIFFLLFSLPLSSLENQTPQKTDYRN